MEKGGDISFCGVLAILFITLKLIGIINWPWVWGLAPIWIPAIVVVIAFIIAIFFK